MENICKDLNACLKFHSVDNCLVEYDINLTEITQTEEFMTTSEAETLHYMVIGCAFGATLVLILIACLVHKCTKSCLIPKIEDFTAKKYTSAHTFYARRLERNPNDRKAQVYHEVALLNHIKTTYKHHENDPEKRLYQDVVNALTEYKKLHREAMLNKSVNFDQTLTLKESDNK